VRARARERDLHSTGGILTEQQLRAHRHHLLRQRLLALLRLPHPAQHLPSCLLLAPQPPGVPRTRTQTRPRTHGNARTRHAPHTNPRPLPHARMHTQPHGRTLSQHRECCARGGQWLCQQHRAPHARAPHACSRSAAPAAAALVPRRALPPLLLPGEWAVRDKREGRMRELGRTYTTRYIAYTKNPCPRIRRPSQPSPKHLGSKRGGFLLQFFHA
jgi:hypothetical protein